MNMEELKLIADTITSLGAQGKEAFIWYLALDRLPGFIIGLSALCTILYISSAVIKSSKYNSKSEELIRNIASSLGINTVGLYRYQLINKISDEIKRLQKRASHENSTD